MKRKIGVKKRAITLIEIMIVILLIGLIGGVLAYNLRGSLDEGKKFKTVQGAEQIRNILLMEVAKGEYSMSEAASHWQDIIEHSPLVKDPKNLINDGWGEKYQVSVDPSGEGFDVYSTHLPKS